MFAEVTLPPYRTGVSAARTPQPAGRPGLPGSRRPSPPRRCPMRSGRCRSPRRARRRSTRPAVASATRVDAREAILGPAYRRPRSPGLPRGRRAARRRTGSGGARRRVLGRASSPISCVRLAGVAAALGVADDDPGREALEHRRGDLPGERAGELVMDVLGADRRRPGRRGEGVANGSEADERRAEHPGDPGLARPRRDRPRQLAGVGRRRVHLPVAGDDHVTHERESCQSTSRGRLRWRSGRLLLGEPLDPLEGSLHRRAMDLEPLRELARVASGVSRRAAATSADDVRAARRAGRRRRARRSRRAAGPRRPPRAGGSPTRR